MFPADTARAQGRKRSASRPKLKPLIPNDFSSQTQAQILLYFPTQRQPRLPRENPSVTSR